MNVVSIENKVLREFEEMDQLRESQDYEICASYALKSEVEKFVDIEDQYEYFKRGYIEGIVGKQRANLANDEYIGNRNYLYGCYHRGYTVAMNKKSLH